MRKTSGQVGRGSCSERSQSGAQTDVELPTPRVAPIVFVTSPDGSWFSATGQMSDDDPANSSHNTTVTAESAIGGGSSGAGATSLPFLLLLSLAAFLARRRAAAMTTDS